MLQNDTLTAIANPYNPNIAYVFYLAGFIESWGRGVEKICNALKADNLPMPEYTVNSGDIMIKFTGPEDRIIRVSGGLSEKLSEKLSDMCLRRGESEDRLERRNRAKGHLDIDLEEFDRRRSYFFVREQDFISPFISSALMVVMVR